LTLCHDRFYAKVAAVIDPGAPDGEWLCVAVVRLAITTTAPAKKSVGLLAGILISGFGSSQSSLIFLNVYEPSIAQTLRRDQIGASGFTGGQRRYRGRCAPASSPTLLLAPGL
jgi:hypothetical protein